MELIDGTVVATVRSQYRYRSCDKIGRICGYWLSDGKYGRGKKSPEKIETDDDAIIALKKLMASIKDQDHSIDLMQRLFDIGEWFLSSEGAWVLAKDDPVHPLRQVDAYRQLETYFAEKLV